LNYETNSSLEAQIFNVTNANFNITAQKIAGFQLQFNPLYRQYANAIGFNLEAPQSETGKIPFLPISFFKTHAVKAFEEEPQIEFSSSGTTGMLSSKHLVKTVSIYEESFIKGFKHFYGEPSNYAFLCLLPSYLERGGSSLIYMAETLVALSGQADSGFFLQAKGKMVDILKKREAAAMPTILIGVTYALLDFAEQSPIKLNNTYIMETGGMKGRRQEITRAELHENLKAAFGVASIHSEYGMTELLSQAYAKKDGVFACPPWMKMFVRAEDDPFDIKEQGTGLLCIADLANLYSCSFIETSDVAKIYADGTFEVLGRMDNSDVRGCSLLAL
jgi:acyl-coenzyme A synthetase/AMP-(fatty) acid ligase